ncbi:MAG: type II secretion system F family protein [Holosporaceae bacterium]|jgi:tight adherence protein B|nr:type II secretion system F family protein [Holosporaceae bacterium]
MSNLLAMNLDVVTTFIIAFFTCFLIYKLLVKQRQSENYNAILAQKVDTIAKQQDMLLEAASEHVSTFAKLEAAHEDAGSGDVVGDYSTKIKMIMKRAGIAEMKVSTFVIICATSGCFFAIFIIYFKFLNIITGIPIGFTLGAYLSFNFLASQAEKKKMQFLQQFPDAIDMMIRGVKAGLNISRVVKLVSMEFKDPIASEYRTINQKLELGVEPEKVFVEAAEKIDIEEFRFLVVALVLQIENGGVLGEILSNLSSLVRKRLELGLKLKAMSAEARMSAIVLSALPFVFAAIMAFLMPSHLKEFLVPGTGQTLLKIAIALFAVGSFFMIKATKIRV